MVSSIIFDFDGVLVDSNKIKRQTFFDIFSGITGSGSLIEKILQENPNKERSYLIRKIVESMQERSIASFQDIESEVQKRISLYSEITGSRVSSAPEIKGARKSLVALSQQFPLFMLSATPSSNLPSILINRGLESYFKKVYCTDGREKSEVLGDMIKEQSLNPQDSVYIGDSMQDMECAKKYEMNFIGIINDENNFKNNSFIKYKISNLSGLTGIIKMIHFIK